MNKKLSVSTFVETYNDSVAYKNNAPLSIKELDRLYNKLYDMIKEQCGTEIVPDFQINIFGKINRLHGGLVI